MTVMTFDPWCLLHLAIGLAAGVLLGAYGMLKAILAWGAE